MLVKGDLRIMCGKCGKQVDELRRVYDVARDMTAYTVICHSEKETTVLTGMDMMESYGIEGATAFVQPLALAGEKKE